MWWELRRRWILWGYLRRIRKHGWTATYVPGDGEIASLAYSTGFFEDVGAPEIVMFGMPPEAASHLMGVIRDELKAGTLVLTDKAAWDPGWGEGPKLAWRAVHASQIRRAHFNVAIWYREQKGLSRDGLQAFQLVVSDTNGKFPWEDGFDVNYRPRQPEPTCRLKGHWTMIDAA